MSYSGIRAMDDEDATERFVRGRRTSVWSMFSTSTEQGLERAMEGQHMMMMALGGAIKAAVFTSTNRTWAIELAGPGGALLSYVAVGLFVCTATTPLAEIAALFPVSGAFAVFGSRFVSPALGFALGWLYCVQWILLIREYVRTLDERRHDGVFFLGLAWGVANEMRVVAAILQSWKAHLEVQPWQCALMILVPVFLVQLIRIRIYGELQYWCVSLVITVIFLYAIISPIGSNRDVPSYFQSESAFVNGFYGFAQALSHAVYSFEGIELVAVAAGESARPWKTVPNAMKGALFRIAFLYMLATLSTGLTPSEYQTVSYFVGNYVVNAVLLIAVLSAINAGFYGSSRMLFALARTGQAPRIFGWANERGVPVPALLMSLAILTARWGDDVVPTWLLNLTSTSSLLLWGSIGLISFRFRAAWRAQGRSLDDLPYAQPLFPLLPICAVVLATLMSVSGGYAAVKGRSLSGSASEGYVVITQPFSTRDVVATYMGVALFVMLYVGYAAYERVALGKRQHFVRLSEVDLDTEATWKAGGRWDAIPGGVGRVRGLIGHHPSEGVGVVMMDESDRRGEWT